MKLPVTSTVPDFILELVRVAPDECRIPKDRLAAEEQLRQLNMALTNPVVLHCISRVAVALLAMPATVENATFEGIHDVFTQQQLIGEGRGLRRLLAELEDCYNELVAVTQN